jgi:hypothetical protein
MRFCTFFVSGFYTGDFFIDYLRQGETRSGTSQNFVNHGMA